MSIQRSRRRLPALLATTPASATAHAGAFGAGQHIGLAKFAAGPALLLKPGQAKLGVVVKIVFG